MLASTVPTCLSYDPAFVYELAVILQDGIRRMYQEGEPVFYYITMYNEDYADGRNAGGCREGIVRGIYKFKSAPEGKAAKASVAQLFGSGPILNEVVRAQEILAEKYSVQTDVWSVTSYNELRREALSSRTLEPPASRQKRKRPHTSCRPSKAQKARSSPRATT